MKSDLDKKAFNTIPGIIEGPVQPEYDNRFNGREFSLRQPEPSKADYMSKIKAGQDAYKKKTDYSQFGKAIAEAQKEIAKVTVIPVRIVEIKE